MPQKGRDQIQLTCCNCSAVGSSGVGSSALEESGFRSWPSDPPSPSLAVSKPSSFMEDSSVWALEGSGISVFVPFFVVSRSAHGSIATIFVFYERRKRSDQRKEERKKKKVFGDRSRRVEGLLGFKAAMESFRETMLGIIGKQRRKGKYCWKAVVGPIWYLTSQDYAKFHHHGLGPLERDFFFLF